ncbi:hypothetical protein K5L12_05795 [Mycolicibacterium austroafricanum]|uniref:hypothetical protein n=2 Tax=Mycolicibacterium austroafricanum TaxID=39687 RepID=UPI00056886DE|nr:hypothetical protein [Mycolicibacterium austroafricanum]QZY47246.1 hypothetical protein K5L12_05795 [Mycolicibacterium austroafricanum]
MSLLPSSVRAMTDRHRRRRTKQARRDARRARKRRAGTGSEPPPDDPQQDPTNALSPWSFLVFASQQVEAAKPDPLANFRSHQEDPIDIDYLVKSLVDDPDPGSASVVALFAELLDGELQLRCREALNAYNGPLVPWVTALRDVDVYRAVRLTHVLGDFDQILLGARLLDGQEATCGVLINHLDDSEIADAALFVVTIDDAVDELSGPDCTAADMSLADARAWIECGLKRNFIFRDTATWPDCRPLLQWLVGRLPDGGDLYQSPMWDPDASKALFDEFFASEAGAVFDSRDHRYLLQELTESGTADPLRWSAARVEQVLDSPLSEGDHPLKVLLDVPALLRAYIPFAHERSGIREGLTARALAALDWRDVGARSA